MYKKILCIISFLFLLCMSNYYCFNVSAEETKESIDEYEYVDNIDEYITMEISIGGSKIKIDALISENNIDNIEDSILSSNLLIGKKYIDKNQTKYRQCSIYCEDSDYLTTSYCTWESENVDGYKKETLRYNFKLKDDINFELDNITTIIPLYSDYKINSSSSGNIDYNNNTCVFTYEQAKLDCYVEAVRLTKLIETSPQKNINIIIPQPTPQPVQQAPAPRDKIKPTVTGVKNNKTYKKQVTIKFSDKQSGIKKATLNGKKIKSGKKVKKNGKYTLKVYDKAGNVIQVKFTIKIKKK